MSAQLPQFLTIQTSAFNVFFADTCKVLDEAAIIKAAHAFFFADEDAPAGKVARYMRAMEAH